MLFLLDANVRTVKWNGIPLHEASSAIVKEETNGDFYLTVRYPITDSGIYQLIKEDMLIKAPVPVLGDQLFRIKRPIENDDSLDLTAYHVSDDIMKRSITPVSVVGQSCATALSQMVQNAKTDLGDYSFTSDIMDSRTFNTTETETLYSVLMDGKHSIVGTWEGELVRDNFALSIKRSRGADRGVVITTHKNLKSYQRTKNSQGIVTRIYARSTFKPDGAEDEVTLRVTVDSPLINSYPYINEKEYENNNAKTVEDLRKWAEAKFTNEGIDKVSDSIEIEAYELDGQIAHLGDTVNLKSRKHSADLYKKAIAYEFNALTEEYVSITFDDKPGVGGTGVSSGLSKAADAILGVNSTAQEIAIQKATDNANRAFDTEFDKRETALRDGIEQAKADAEVYADNIRQEIAGRMSEVDKKVAANQAQQVTQYAEILAKANVNTSLAQEAKNLGNQAKLDATQAKSQLNQVKSEVDEVNRQILQRVTRSEFDPISQRLTNAETSIRTQAGQIEQRLTSTQVGQLIEGKGYQTASQVQQVVTQSADSLTRTISQVEAKILTQVGGTNLLLNTASLPLGDRYNGTWQSVSGGNGTATVVDFSDFPINGISKGIRVVNNTNGGNKDLAQFIDLKVGERYTISAWARVSAQSPIDSVSFLMRSWGHTGTADRNKYLVRKITNKNWVRYSFTFTADAVLNSIQFGQQGAGIIEVCGFKLETGTASTEYSPAPADLVQAVAFNEVKDTVTAHTRTIAEQGQSISQVVQTAQGLVSRVSVLMDAQNLVYDPTRYSKYIPRNSTSNLQLAAYSLYSGMRISASGLASDTYSGFRLPLRTSTFAKGEKLSLRAVIGIDALPDSGGQIKFEIKHQGSIIAYFWLNPTRTGNNQIFTSTTTVNISTTAIDEYGLDVLINRNGNVNITQISIVRGDQIPSTFVDSTTAQDLAISTQVSQLAGSYAIQNLNSAGDLINGINFGADGNNRLSGKATHITGETLIDNAVIKSAMVDKLKTANFESGSVTATVIGAEAVTADKLKVDQALFNKLSANEAYLRQLFAKNAFITSVQAVSMSATKIVGGVLKSTNNATNFNLQTGWIDINAESVGIRNLWPNYPIQYLVFGRGAINGKSASYTALMSNSKRAIGMNDGSAGIQIWNAMDNTTAVNLYGDEIAFMYNASDKRGVNLNVVTNVLSGIEDIHIKGKSLVAVLNTIFENFRNLDHDGNYQRGYYATW